MKRFLLLTTVLLSLSSMAQTKEIKNFPLIANPNLTKNAELVNANLLTKNEVVQLAVTIINPSQSEAVKAGSCRLQIELGDKVKLINKEALEHMLLQDHFKWSIITDDKGIIWLNGKLNTDMQGDFAGTLRIDLQCIETGASAIKMQWFSTTDNSKIGALNTIDFTINKSKTKK